jgi:CHAD domain-containing protein
MAKSRKWKIKGLENKTPFADAGKIVLMQRQKVLVASIKKFLTDESVENLHDIRITLRRLRYNMEIFFDCFDKKRFLVFYKKISSLQDLTGSKRDLDVLIENIKSVSTNNKTGAINSFIKRVEEKKSFLNDNLILELMDFIHCKELKDFVKMIS